MSETISERLEKARDRIERLDPEELSALLDEVTVVDVRCAEDRESTGVIPGSIAVPMTVLEWRCDPTSPFSNELVARPDRRTILYCTDGYSSSLAAASLADLGFERSGDLVGGIRAWMRAGLPLQPAAEQMQAPYVPPS